MQLQSTLICMENKAEETGQTSLFLLVRNADNVEDVIRKKNQNQKLTHHIACLMGKKKHAQHIDPENDKLLYRRERRCPDRPIPTRRNSGKE